TGAPACGPLVDRSRAVWTTRPPRGPRRARPPAPALAGQSIPQRRCPRRRHRRQAARPKRGRPRARSCRSRRCPPAGWPPHERAVVPDDAPRARVPVVAEKDERLQAVEAGAQQVARRRLERRQDLVLLRLREPREPRRVADDEGRDVLEVREEPPK